MPVTSRSTASPWPTAAAPVCPPSAENVGYGLRRSPERPRRVEESLALVGLRGMADRSPGTLSGGQQQRVALARALAPRPRALLLDEPFSNLDTVLRVQVRGEVKSLLSRLGITSVFVTHDQEEAFVLGDEVAVMSAGRLVQQAPPAQLYAEPATPWVATFVGEANLVPGEAAGDEAVTVLGRVPLREPRTGPVEVLLRPEDMVVEPDAVARGTGGAPGTVERCEYYGHDSVTLVRLDGGLVLRTRRAGPPPAVGGERVVLRPAVVSAVAFAAPSAVVEGRRDAAVPLPLSAPATVPG